MWPAMTLGEYAALEKSLGTPLLRVGGVWWRRVRPFFYRPLFPFAPQTRPPACPVAARIGGWQYAVPEGQPANSHLNYMIFDRPQGYDARSLKPAVRRRQRLALEQLRFSPLTDLGELATEGLRCLREFFARTDDYGFRRDRLRPEVFRRWAAALLAEPKVLVMGAYAGRELCEVHVSFRVEGVIFFEVSFASAEGRRRRSNDGMWHLLRTEAASTDAAFINVGPAGARLGIDGFKLRRGARPFSLPARLHINPLARAALGLLRPAAYERLYGMDEAAAERYCAACPAG